MKKISSVKVFVHQTLGFSVQSGKESPRPAIYNKFSTPAKSLPEFINHGAVDVSIGRGWSENSRLAIISDTPTPCTILAVQSVVEFGAGGKGAQV